MELKVKVHSLIDVITNSSTEIFIVMNNGAEKGMFEVLNNVLKVAGSDKKAEDLFDISIEQDWNMISDQFIYNGHYNDYPESIELVEGEKELIEKYAGIKDWKERENYKMNIIASYLKVSGRWEDFSYGIYDQQFHTYLKVVPKNKEEFPIDIWEQIEKLFESVEYSTE